MIGDSAQSILDRRAAQAKANREAMPQPAPTGSRSGEPRPDRAASGACELGMAYQSYEAAKKAGDELEEIRLWADYLDAVEAGMAEKQKSVAEDLR